MTAATVLFTPAADIPGAPRCPHRNGPYGTLQCEKVDHHHLADYPGSADCAARDGRGAWLFWTSPRPAARLSCLAAHPSNPFIVCRLAAGHDHTAGRVTHTDTLAGDVSWLEIRDLQQRTRRAALR